jgi:hypothetical protein
LGNPPLKLRDAVKHAAEGKRFFLSEHLLNVGNRTSFLDLQSSYASSMLGA